MAQLGYWDYVKKAFFARPYVKGLGQMPANELAVLAVGVLGFVNPGFWILGAGLEIGYLAMLSHNPRFRKWVDSMQAAAASGDLAARKEAVLGGLNEPRQRRYRKLEASCAQMLSSTRGLAAGGALDQQVYENVNRLLWIYLKLLATSQVLADHLEAVSREKLEQEIAIYQREHDAALQDPSKERIAKSLAGTLEIAQKRLENLDKAQEDAQFIQAELHRIEQQVSLMIQEATLARDSSFLTDRVDTVMQSFSQTQDWMKANAELLGPVQEELDVPPPTFQMEGPA